MYNNTISVEFPYKISEYIKKRFGEEFHFETRTAENEENDIFYEVEFRQGDLFYHLKFDKSGSLLEREIYHA